MKAQTEERTTQQMMMKAALKVMKLGDWRDGLVVYQYYLLFRKTQVQFPALVWQLITVCSSSSREPNTLIDIHAGKTLMYIK